MVYLRQQSTMKLLFATLIVLMFISCKKRERDDDSLVFRYNEAGNITSLDPAFSKVNALSRSFVTLFCQP